MTDLGTAEGQSLSAAEAINDRGLAVGQSGGPAVWGRREATRLRLPPGAAGFGEAFDVNGRGDVVGYAGFPGGPGIYRAVVWRHGRPTELGLEGGNSHAIGINDRGVIVGFRETVPASEWNAFVWDRGRVADLLSLTGAGGGASDINDRGEVVGISPVPDDPYGIGHAVLWR